MHLLLIIRRKLKIFNRYEVYLKVITIFAIISSMVMGYMHYYENLDWVDSFYFTMTTATTVGYGDISPQKDIGKVLIIPMYQIMGVGMLGLIIGFVTDVVLRISRLRRKGLSKMKKDVSVLIIGYPNELKVRTIVEQLQADERFKNEKVVCLNNELDETPMWMSEKGVHFIKGVGSDVKALNKANVKTAKRTLILANRIGDISSDDESTSTVTVVKSLNPDTYTIVERVRNDLILFNNSRADVVIKENKAEILAQEILDKGASQFEEAIFSNETRGTQFNIEYIGEETTWKEIGMALFLKELIPEGFLIKEQTLFNFSPRLNDIIPNGTIIKYRGDKPLGNTIKLS